MVTGHTRLEQAVRVWLPVGFFLLLALFPFYWMAITSVKPNAELYNRNMMPLLVHNPTLKHYVGLLTETSFLLWTWNTLLVAVISTAISLVLGTMLAYPLARMRFAGAGLIAMTVAAIYLVPQPLLFLPLADVINRLDLGNTGRAAAPGCGLRFGMGEIDAIERDEAAKALAQCLDTEKRGAQGFIVLCSGGKRC